MGDRDAGFRVRVWSGIDDEPISGPAAVVVFTNLTNAVGRLGSGLKIIASVVSSDLIYAIGHLGCYWTIVRVLIAASANGRGRGLPSPLSRVPRVRAK